MHYKRVLQEGGGGVKASDALGRHFAASGGSRRCGGSARTGSRAAGKLMRSICAGASNGIFHRRSGLPILIHEKQTLRLPARFVSCKYVGPALNF